MDSTRRTLLTTAAAATAAAASRAFAQQPGGGAVMPVYQKGAVRIHFEEAGARQLKGVPGEWELFAVKG